jgi:hypothetical protein
VHHLRVPECLGKVLSTGLRGLQRHQSQAPSKWREIYKGKYDGVWIPKAVSFLAQSLYQDAAPNPYQLSAWWYLLLRAMLLTWVYGSLVFNIKREIISANGLLSNTYTTTTIRDGKGANTPITKQSKSIPSLREVTLKTLKILKILKLHSSQSRLSCGIDATIESVLELLFCFGENG